VGDITLKLATMRALLLVCMLGLAGLAAGDRQLRQVHEQELLGAKVGTKLVCRGAPRHGMGLSSCSTLSAVPGKPAPGVLAMDGQAQEGVC
jgi:hypothetical protein